MSAVSDQTELFTDYADGFGGRVGPSASITWTPGGEPSGGSVYDPGRETDGPDNPEPASVLSQSVTWSTLARDRGADAAARSDPEWTRKAEGVLAEFASDLVTFTADDIRDRCGAPGSNGQLGSLFLNASKAGRIVCEGYTYSSRIVGHRRKIAVWRGSPHTKKSPK